MYVISFFFGVLALACISFLSIGMAIVFLAAIIRGFTEE